MHFYYSLTPNMFVYKVFIWENWTHKKVIKNVLWDIPKINVYGGQNASIFHKKKYSGVKKYFLVFFPLKIQFLRFFCIILWG